MNTYPKTPYLLLAFRMTLVSWCYYGQCYCVCVCFFLEFSVQIRSEVYPVSFSMGTKVLSPETEPTLACN